MNIKLPAAYDVSHWKEIPDFGVVNPRPMLFITKATESYPDTGYNHTDEKFVRFMEGFQSIGCSRGAYHFHRKNFSAARQAEHFINVVSKIDILSTDILILDVEEGGEKASRLWIWFETVRQAYPENPLMLYSAKYILNQIAMTDGEKEYFKRIPVWTAGYPWFPDLYSVCPASYIPDQSRFGEVLLWQYSGKGVVEGIIGSVDLNWMHPKLIDIVSRTQIGDVVSMNASGKCINANNKVWASVGGSVIGACRIDEAVNIDQEQMVSGVKYIHLRNSRIGGWSKAQWFSYSPIVNPPPPPVPEPEPETEYILHVKDGITRKFIPE